MKRCHSLAFLLFILVGIFGCQELSAAKTVKIKLTGSAYENIKVSIGQTGRSEVVSSVPYSLEVPKEALP
ncbi:MAG: hypothetical protein K2K72_00800, partial [Duncaniella sp.]|nr:hypothetical protein [Duncaniella sp.]